MLRSSSLVYLFGIFTSLLLSIWVINQETVINTDAVCYLLSAEMIDASGLRAAMHLCGQAIWPFYSFLIHGLVKISPLSYQAAAYSMNAVFTALSVFFFIRIVKELGGAGRVLWLAAFVILLSHEFNSVREYIVRDHGFWAFYLASIFFLLRFFNTLTIKPALLFSASLLMATLFRIEGAIFLLAVPFLTWFLTQYSLKARLKYFLMLNLLTLLIGVGILAWLLLHPQETLTQLGRVAEVPNQFLNGFKLISERYVLTKNSLAEHVLTMESASEAGFVLALVIFVWYVLSVIQNLSFGYALLTSYAWIRNIHPLKGVGLLVVLGYLFINVVITFGFLAEKLFLSKRYLIALSLVLMLWVPFALHHLLNQWSLHKQRLFSILVCVFIFISALGGIFEFGHSKAYISRAGNWLAVNVPTSASLYTNDYMVMYYSKHFGSDIFKIREAYKQIDTIAQGKWKQYDYLALRLSKKEAANVEMVLKEIQMKPITEFNNKHGDRVVIFSNR